MVPVPDVLRQLLKETSPKAPRDRALLKLLSDFAFRRCALYHPSTPLLTSVSDLPGVEAEALFVGEYDRGRQTYEGTWHWFSKLNVDQPSVDLADCVAFQDHLNRFMALPGWTGGVDSLDELPLPKAATIGGLLICRNGPAWITLALVPVDLTPAVWLTHITLALTTALAKIASCPEDYIMKVAHPMIATAERTMRRSGNRRQLTLLQSCLEAMRSGELVVAGVNADEQAAWLSPDNQQTMVFLLAAGPYREQNNNPVRYWVEWAELEDAPATLSHHVEERLVRFLKRRRSIVADEDVVDPDGYIVPPGVIHAAWVITRHPHDGLTTWLLRRSTLDTVLALTFLEQAVQQEFLPPGQGRRP